MTRPVTSSPASQPADGAEPVAAPDPTGPVTARGRGQRPSLERMIQRQALAGILIVLVVIFWISSPYFFTVSNFLTIGSTAGVLGIMAVAQTFLVISGGIDISIGSAAATAGVVLGWVYGRGYTIWTAVLAALVSALIIGAINGALVVKLKLDPLVVTLGSYSVFLGAAYVISGTKTLVISDSSFDYLGNGKVGPLPFTLFLFLVVILLGLFVERFTVFGRNVYAIGGNMDAARLAGLRVNLNRFYLYVASGLSAGVAGVLLASQLGTSSPNVGATYLLSVVTAVILGGASLKGGRGSLLGTFVAVAILGVLQNGFALLQYSSFTQTMVLGIFLIAAVTLDQTLRSRTFRRRRTP